MLRVDALQKHPALLTSTVPAVLQLLTAWFIALFPTYVADGVATVKRDAFCMHVCVLSLFKMTT